MKWELENGKVINIPDSEIEKLMKSLDIEEGEAIELYLADNDFEENEEQNALDESAKKVKINHGAGSSGKEKKPRTVKISDEKQEIFEFLTNVLPKNYDITVLKENKLIEIAYNGKKFKLDLIETRQKK